MNWPYRSGSLQVPGLWCHSSRLSEEDGGGLPVEYVIQAKNLEDLKRVIPRFMEEVNKSPVFSVADVNLKFTKPELTIHIDRDKAAVLGVSMQNIAQNFTAYDE